MGGVLGGDQVWVQLNPFVDPEGMTGGQLAWAAVSYGYMLFWASNLISDGSELLLLIPAYAGLVGGIVLPVLGAVPDAMMVLFSGIGPLEVAQDKIAVGVGALAGSTIMLLCIPWILSIYAGRVDIENGVCNYKKRPKLENSGLTNTGIEANPKKNRVGAAIMLATSLCYLIIQVPAFQSDNQVLISPETVVEQLPNIRREGAAENLYALVGSVVCLAGFAVYLYLQWKAGQESETAPQQKEGDNNGGSMMIKTNSVVSSLPMPGRKMSCTADNILGMAQQNGLLLWLDDFRKTNQDNLRIGLDQGLIETVQLDHTLMSMLRNLFKKYACRVDDDRLLDRSEFETLFDEMKLGYSREEVEEQFKKADINSDKHVNFDEFVRCFVNLAATPPKPTPRTTNRMSSAMTSSLSMGRNQGLASCKEEKDNNDDDDDDNDDEDDEESEEEEDDFKDLEPYERKRRILLKSFQQMGLGTLIVLSFSDPMVDVLSAMGRDMGINPFYVSFVLAPIASNASELTAAFNFASKKTKSSITISLDTLLGAACMNNTFCLGVFLALVYYQGLAWKFSAETLTILVTEWIMFAYVMVKKTQTMADGFFVLALYPLSLALVYALENFVGLD